MSNYFGEWNVQIMHTPGRFQQRVYLFQRNKGNVIFLCKDGNQRMYDDAVQYNDDDVYFAEMDDDQLSAFAQALSDKGVKTNKDSIAEGKLAATEKHLEDMRSLVFKNRK